MISSPVSLRVFRVSQAWLVVYGELRRVRPVSLEPPAQGLFQLLQLCLLLWCYEAIHFSWAAFVHRWFSYLIVRVTVLLPLVSDRDPMVITGSPVCLHWT